MSSTTPAQRSAYRALFFLLPLDRLAVMILGLFVAATINVPIVSIPAGIAALVASGLTALWAFRSAGTWLELFGLVRRGTPAPMLRAAAAVIESWPTLVETCRWIPNDVLGSRLPLVVRLAGQLTGNDTASGPRVVRLEEHPAGWVTIVSLTPSCGASDIASATETIADLWGAQRVEVTRPGPGLAAILAVVRDPLSGTRRAFTDVNSRKPDVSASDFVDEGGATDETR